MYVLNHRHNHLRFRYDERALNTGLTVANKKANACHKTRLVNCDPMLLQRSQQELCFVISITQNLTKDHF